MRPQTETNAAPSVFIGDGRQGDSSISENAEMETFPSQRRQLSSGVPKIDWVMRNDESCESTRWLPGGGIAYR